MTAPQTPWTARPLVDVIELRGDVASVAIARDFVRHRLTTWHLDEEAVENGVLLVSELVTNAVVHGCAYPATPIYNALADDQPDVVVRLRLRVGRLRIETFDPSLNVPRRITVTSADEHGRGLRLLDELSERWSYQVLTFGKVVWCEVAVHIARPTTPERVETMDTCPSGSMPSDIEDDQTLVIPRLEPAARRIDLRDLASVGAPA